jgi:GTP-binding protein
MTSPFRDPAAPAPAAPPPAASKSRQAAKTSVASPTAGLPKAGIADAPAAALAWLHGARFLTTASRLEQLPGAELPEIAFVGRSNAGKSSAINRLTQQRRLAFASRTPGRTQHINLFELGPRDAPDALLADLPGYGYAAVARSAKLRWQEVMAQYLELRRPLHGLVLLVDSRLGLTDLDRRLLALVAPRVVSGELHLLVLLTKADKLNRSERQRALAAAQEELGTLAGHSADIGVSTFSTLSGEGVADVAEALRGWIEPPALAAEAADAATAAALAATEPPSP